MATHDYTIANASGAAFRADINNVLAAIVGNNTNATAPTTTFANMLWYDSTADILKERNAANTAWIELIAFDQTADTITAKHTIWIPAAAMRPTVSNPCASLTDVETTAGNPDMQVLDFDDAADEHAQFQVAFPKSWDKDTVTFRVYWTVSAAVTTGVAWALQGVAVSDSDPIDVAYGTAVVVTDDALNAAEDLHITAESAVVTIAGTPADADECFFRIFRDVSDGNDDMTQDARLLGVQVFYTIDARDDT